MKTSEKVFKFKLSETDVARLKKISKNSVGEGLVFLITEGVKHLSKKSA